MKIKALEKEVELSYIDLLNGLFTDVYNDTIPPKDKKQVIRRIEEIESILARYSA